MKATFTDEQQQLAELAGRIAERIGIDARAGGGAAAGSESAIDHHDAQQQ